MATSDFLIVSADALAGATITKAATWQDAVRAYAQINPDGPPRLACVQIVGQVNHARVEANPVVNITVTPE